MLNFGGKLAVLIGDGKHQGRYLGLPFRMIQAAEAEGLWLAAPEIVRFQHGASSSRKRYSHAFIPRLHDLCFVLEAVGSGNPHHPRVARTSQDDVDKDPDRKR